MDKVIIITFSSTHTALKAEEICKELKLDFELIPTPREISAECGFALMVKHIEPDVLHDLCEKRKIRFYGIYLKNMEKGEKIYEKSY
jgi:hypothetical protein